MSYKISKELFEKVMNVKLTTDLSIAPYYNEVNGCEEEDLILINYNFIWIPLDTFFFKCFDWAFENGYVLSFCTNDLSRLLRYSCLAEPLDNSSDYKEILLSNQQQTVFDACQWILDNKEQK